jgi:hypothetical protein
MHTDATKTASNGKVSFLSTVENVVDITGAVTLTDKNSGQVCILKAAAGAAITLPAATSKWDLTFKTGLAFATSGWVLTLPSAVLQGGAIVNSVFVACASRNTITFSASAETLGDTLHLICDGTNVYVSGVGASAASIAFTTV